MGDRYVHTEQISAIGSSGLKILHGEDLSKKS